MTLSSCQCFELPRHDRPLRRDGLLWSELIDGGVASRAWSLTSPPGHWACACVLPWPRAQSAVCSIPISGSSRETRRGAALTHSAGLPPLRSRRRETVASPGRTTTAADGLLLLLPNNQRVVIEVGGRPKHFTRDGKPSLAAYAEMVAADRDLRGWPAMKSTAQDHSDGLIAKLSAGVSAGGN